MSKYMSLYTNIFFLELIHIHFGRNAENIPLA